MYYAINYIGNNMHKYTESPDKYQILEVIKENNIAAQIEKISDINKFADLGVFMTPGLLINNQVFSAGKMPTKSTLTQWIINSQK